MKSFNKTSFTKLATATVTAGQTVAENLQQLIEMGLDHYNKSGDTEYLTRCIVTAQKARSVKADSIKLYIREHANVKWVEAEGKEPVFRKIGKGSQPEVKAPEVDWPEYTGQDKVTPDFDIDKALEQLLKKASKSVEDDKVAEEKLAHTLELMSQLKELTA